MKNKSCKTVRLPACVLIDPNDPTNVIHQAETIWRPIATASEAAAAAAANAPKSTGDNNPSSTSSVGNSSSNDDDSSNMVSCDSSHVKNLDHELAAEATSKDDEDEDDDDDDDDDDVVVKKTAPKPWNSPLPRRKHPRTEICRKKGDGVAKRSKPAAVFKHTRPGPWKPAPRHKHPGTEMFRKTGDDDNSHNTSKQPARVQQHKRKSQPTEPQVVVGMNIHKWLEDGKWHHGVILLGPNVVKDKHGNAVVDTFCVRCCDLGGEEKDHSKDEIALCVRLHAHKLLWMPPSEIHVPKRKQSRRWTDRMKPPFFLEVSQRGSCSIATPTSSPSKKS